jgi:hypothetical protein
MHNHNSIKKIGVSEEMPLRITEDPKKRRLTTEAHPFKVHVDDSNLEDLPDELREYLVNVVAKQGNKIFAEKISVKGYQSIPASKAIYESCEDNPIIKIPEHYDYEDTDADFLLFLGFMDKDDGTLAYATPCLMEKGTLRPNVGFAVFNIKYLDPAKGNLDNDVATYVHEVLHALVFSGELFKNFPPTKAGKAQYVVKNGRHYLRGDNLMAVARDHFQCYDKDFKAIVLEDEGGAGSAGSHFERIMFGDETMVAEDVTTAKFSKMTLAVLKDSGWYEIDLTKGDLWTWGKGEGCALLYKTCTNSSVDETCGTNNNFGCDKTFNSKMSCTSSPFTNQCNIKTTGKSCSKMTDDKYSFETYGMNSKCQEYKHKGEKKASCVDIKCNRNKTSYRVKLLGDHPAEFICKSEGQVETPWEGYQFFCENPELICRNLCPRSCYHRGKCLENGQCSCDPFYSGEICGTFNECDGVSSDLCDKILDSNQLNTSGFINTYGAKDFDVDYLSYSSWNDQRSGHWMETDSGV